MNFQSAFACLLSAAMTFPAPASAYYRVVEGGVSGLVGGPGSAGAGTRGRGGRIGSDGIRLTRTDAGLGKNVLVGVNNSVQIRTGASVEAATFNAVIREGGISDAVLRGIEAGGDAASTGGARKDAAVEPSGAPRNTAVGGGTAVERVRGPADPKPQEAEPAATGVRTLDETMDKVRRVQREEISGVAGASEHMLKEMFHAQKAPSGAGDRDSSGAGGAVKGRAPAGDEFGQAVMNARSAAAENPGTPGFYERAFLSVQDQVKRGAVGAGEGIALAWELKRGGLSKAREGLPLLGRKAFSAAAEGVSPGDNIYGKAIRDWDRVLGIQDAADVDAALKRVAELRRSSKGKNPASPTADFVAVSDGDSIRLRAVVRYPEGYSAGVQELDAKAFVSGLALADLTVATISPEAAAEDFQLHESVRMPARGWFGAHRSAGASLFASFWLSARRFFSALADLWQMIKSFVMSLFGRGAAFRITVSDSLRAAPAATLSPRSAAAVFTAGPYRLAAVPIEP